MRSGLRVFECNMSYAEVMFTPGASPDVRRLWVAHFPKSEKPHTSAAEMRWQLNVRSDDDSGLARLGQALVWSHDCLDGPE